MHPHSLFHVPDVSFDRVSQFIPALARVKNPIHSACFYLAKKESLDGYAVCAICMDSVRLDELENWRIMRIFNMPEEDKYLERNKGDVVLFVTPCNHIFHKDCLQRWASENAQCPVDRQPIPPCGQSVWYEWIDSNLYYTKRTITLLYYLWLVKCWPK